MLLLHYFLDSSITGSCDEKDHCPGEQDCLRRHQHLILTLPSLSFLVKKHLLWPLTLMLKFLSSTPIISATLPSSLLSMGMEHWLAWWPWFTYKACSELWSPIDTIQGVDFQTAIPSNKTLCALNNNIPIWSAKVFTYNLDNKVFPVGTWCVH